MGKEKKEIWMEKLIELLNEYELWEDYGDMWEYYYIDTLWNIVDDGWYILKPCEIISKKFWFIKWLVENDKIDRDIMEGKKFYYYLEKSENMHWDKNFSRCERLLMLLSISDTPIEDLLLYLK